MDRAKKFMRFTKDGFHTARTDVKRSSIQGTHVTFPSGIVHSMGVAHVPMVLLKGEKDVEDKED